MNLENRVIDLLKSGKKPLEIWNKLGVSKEYVEKVINNYKFIITINMAYNLFNQKKYNEALSIIDNSIYSKKIDFVILKVRIYIKLANKETVEFEKLKKLKVAFDLCCIPEYQNSSALAREKAIIYKSIGNYQEALNICENPLFANDIGMQLLRIDLLIIFKKYDVALEICDKYMERNINNMAMKKIEILVILDRIEEALAICDNKPFANDVAFQNKKRSILKKYNENILDVSSLNKVISQNILEQINNNTCTIDTINESNLNPTQVIILTVAYYEKRKYNKNIVIKYLKEQANIFNDDEDILKIINALKNRCLKNNKIFDKEFYEELLKRTPKEKQSIRKIEKVSN